MLRFILPIPENLIESHTIVKTIQGVTRWEGGSWFSETLDEVRRTYAVKKRVCLSKNDNVCVEFLEELPENYSRFPCWQDSIQQVSLLQIPPQLPQSPEYRLELFQWSPQPFQQDLRFPQQEVQQQPLQTPHLQQHQQPSLPFQRLVLSLPASSPLPQWVLELLGPWHKEFQTLGTTNRTFSLPSNQVCHEQPKPQRPKPKAKSPSQIAQSSLPSLKNISSHHPSYPLSSHPKPSEEQVLQPLPQVRSSLSRQGLETGSLCSPVVLPSTPPRKTSLDHPPKRQKRPSQVPLESRRKLSS